MKSHSIEIHYISKTEMDKLRSRFRLDHSPSVLSFSEPPRFVYPKNAPCPLGEIFLCSYYAKKEARKYRMKYHDHAARLIAHGVLHVLGYDHETVKGARRMGSIERRVITDN